MRPASRSSSTRGAARNPRPPTSASEPTLDWETASGCKIYELSLTGTPSEHALTGADAPGESETTPSIWQGNLAFVRHAPNAAVPTIEYLPVGATKPRHLAGGSVPVCAPYGAAHAGCTPALAHETVDQLDLGPTRISYVWSMLGGSVYGTGLAWEMRAATLDGGRSTLLDAGEISGTCGFREPTAPTATSGPISYLEAGAVCDTTETNFATADPVTGVRAQAPTPGGLAATAVRDANTIYWLRITGPAADVPAPGVASCVVADAACQLVASSSPNYVTQHARAPEGSPADIDVVASGLGYTWLRGPAGVRLLRPPATIPCAPSASAAIVYASAQWSGGRHTVVISRQDPGPRSRGIATTKVSLATGVYDYTRLLACGASTRITYAVTTGASTQRVSFAVTRLRVPAKTH